MFIEWIHVLSSYFQSPETNLYLFMLAVLSLCCCTRAFSSCSQKELLSGWGARTSQCCGFSRLSGLSSCSRQAQYLWHTGLVVKQHVESSWIRDWTHVACIGRLITIHCITREVLYQRINQWKKQVCSWVLAVHWGIQTSKQYQDAPEGQNKILGVHMKWIPNLFEGKGSQGICPGGNNVQMRP